MDTIIKNLNYTAEEINDILASVSTKARESELADVKNDLNNLSTYVHEEFKHKTTLAEYGIEDAKIEGDVVTLGGVTIEPLTKNSWEVEKQELLLEIEKLKNRLDILEALGTPDYTLVDSAGNIFASKDGNYFVTKQLN